MTNKEAIEVLQGIYPNGAYSPTEEQRLEAINMAIAALANMQECHVVETLRTEYEKGRYDMREEMMKEAKIGVCDNDNFILFNDGTAIDPEPSMRKTPAFKVNDGDKVKLIIVKEER